MAPQAATMRGRYVPSLDGVYFEVFPVRTALCELELHSQNVDSHGPWPGPIPKRRVHMLCKYPRDQQGIPLLRLELVLTLIPSPREDGNNSKHQASRSW
jgi:hypothetical protein